jgi:type IV secretion system protein VirB11
MRLHADETAGPGLVDCEAVTERLTAESSAHASALAQYVERLRPWLGDATVTELCINRPSEAFIERTSGWQRESMAFATEPWCQQFARLVAGATKQRVNAETPLLSASLPRGERVQVVLPPAVTAGTVAITIRRPSALISRCAQARSLGVSAAEFYVTIE